MRVVSRLDEALPEIAARFGTPCYVYDQVLVDRNVSRFVDIGYPHSKIHFASMANNNPELLQMLRERRVGVFVNSAPHLQLALDCGFTADEIIFASTGVRRADLARLAELGVRVNLDSVGQMELYGSIAPGTECGIRLNIDENSLGNVFIGAESRIGVLENEIPEALAVARRHDLRIVGTHVYLGTNIVSLDTMLDGVRRTLELSDHFPDLAYVDLGGGFPVPEDGVPEFDYATYDTAISALMRDYSTARGREIGLVLEPGRSLFGDTGMFCTSVLDVKSRPDRRLVCVDASASLLPRSLFYGEFNAVEVVGRLDDPPDPLPADVVGCTTYSRDFLAKGAVLPEVAVDDVLVFRNAGSYGYSMMTQFLGQQPPSEVLVGLDGEPRLIRDRGEPVR